MVCSSSVTSPRTLDTGQFDSTAVAELFVGGEGLAQGAESVLTSVDSSDQRPALVVVGIVRLAALFVIAANLVSSSRRTVVVDLLYAVLDPRIRIG